VELKEQQQGAFGLAPGPSSQTHSPRTIPVADPEEHPFIRSKALVDLGRQDDVVNPIHFSI
jgi:hypothetical protein